jgi:outer membrane protein
MHSEHLLRSALLTVLLAVSVAHAQAPPPITLTMNQAALRATEQGLASVASGLRAAQVEARVNQRRADLLPNVTSIIETNSRSFNTSTLGLNFPSLPGQPPFFDPDGQVVGPVPVSDARVRVQQTVFDGAVLARLRLARAQGATGRTEAAFTRAAASTQAAVAYVRVLRAEAVFDARSADSTLAADLLRIARETLRAGTGVALDVTRAESQLIGIRSQLIGARVERDKAWLEFRRLINLPLDQPVQLVDTIGGKNTPLPTEIEALANAQRFRPEVKVIDAQIEAAHLSSSAIRAERLPTVSAVADNGFIGKDPTRLLNTWTYALRVSVPVFEGMRRQARQSEQSLSEQELQVRRADLLAQVGVDVRSSLLDASAAEEGVAAARERLRLAEQEVAQSRDRFRAGVSGNLDVTSALLTLSNARTQLVDALASRHLARVSIARAQGTVASLF